MTSLTFTVDQLGRLHHLATFGNRRSAKRFLRDLVGHGTATDLDGALGLIEGHAEREQIEAVSQQWQEAARASRAMVPGFESGLRELSLEYAKDAIRGAGLFADAPDRMLVLALFPIQMPYDITSYLDRNQDFCAVDLARATLRWGCPLFDHAAAELDIDRMRHMLDDPGIRGSVALHAALQGEVDKAWTLGAIRSAIDGPLVIPGRGDAWPVEVVHAGNTRPEVKWFAEMEEAQDYALLCKAYYPVAQVRVVRARTL